MAAGYIRTSRRYGNPRVRRVGKPKPPTCVSGGDASERTWPHEQHRDGPEHRHPQPRLAAGRVKRSAQVTVIEDCAGDYAAKRLMLEELGIDERYGAA